MKKEKKNIKKEKKITGGDYLALGLYAFLGVGMEVVLLPLEQMFYSNSISEMTSSQHIIHWVLTCIVWGLFAALLARYAKRRYDFHVWGKPQSIPLLNWVIAILLSAICIASNAWSWGTLKILGEFASKTPLLFVFQYIYYIFEVFLVISIVIYGQKAGEMWFGKDKIPWGGILVGISWGLVHALTKGSLFIGLEAMVSGILYGCIYLLMKKQAVYAYILILLAFVL